MFRVARPGEPRPADWLLTAGLANSAQAEVLATAVFDTDSYLFVGANAQFDAGITVGADYSLGVVDPNNTHFNFGVVQFDVTGLQTVADGGPAKFLELETHLFPGSSSFGLSAATADINETYPSFFFPGNPAGNETDRLTWYIDHIKGDDAAYGGYAGGAPHLGVLDVTAAGTYQLDVTATVDAWITGSTPNYGFGLWGIDVAGAFDFASSNNPLGNGPRLVAIPEASSWLLMTVSLAIGAAWSQLRRR